MKQRSHCWLGSLIALHLLTTSLLGQGQPPIPNQPPGQTPGQPPPKAGQPPQPGQPPSGQPKTGQPQSGQPGQPQTVPERRPPALEYALALIAALLVLVIICMPSRKG